MKRRRQQQLESDLQTINNNQHSSSSAGLSAVSSESALAERLRECQRAREQRIATFLDSLRRRREEQISAILRPTPSPTTNTTT